MEKRRERNVEFREATQERRQGRKKDQRRQMRSESARQRKKQTRKHRTCKLAVIVTLLGIAIVVAACLLLFHLQRIQVTGNTYTSKSDVLAWYQEDPYTTNTLYAWIKYNHASPENLTMVDEITIRFLTPWSVQLKVKEKDLLCMYQEKETFYYLDDTGRVVMTLPYAEEGVLLIEGLGQEKSKISELVTFEVSDAIEQLIEITQAIQANELEAVQLSYETDGYHLYLAQTEVLLGKRDFTERIDRILSMLAGLEAEHGRIDGILHLENFETSDGIARFEPAWSLTGEEQNTNEDGDVQD
jgi:cell division septal protein FtsQ